MFRVWSVASGSAVIQRRLDDPNVVLQESATADSCQAAGTTSSRSCVIASALLLVLAFRRCLISVQAVSKAPLTSQTW